MTGRKSQAVAGRRILVTGASGFLGKHLCRRLTASGADVVAVSRSHGIDVTADALPLEGVTHLFHLAGLTSVPDSWQHPQAYYRVNALGTVRILEQCRQRSVPLTYLSAYIYGIPHSLPVREDSPVRPSNPYAFSKYAGEEACRFYADAYRMDVKILRVFNVYGPGQDEAFLIPTIARQVLDPKVNEIVVADLDPRRDFVHVDDVMRALLSSFDLPSGKPFNVGSGSSHSVGEVISACLHSAGRSKSFRSRHQRRAQEIMDVVADVSAIRGAVGWQPSIPFVQGIGTVIRSLS